MNIIKMLADEMKKNGVIKENEYKIYLYGLELAALKIIAAIIALGVSFMLKTTTFLLLLLLFLIPIRKYAGGVHASSPQSCLCLTEIILTGAQLAWKHGIRLEMFQPAVVFLGLLVLIALSPIESKNHKLSDLKRKKFRMASLVYGCVDGIFFGVGFLMDWHLMKASVSWAMFIEMILLVSALPKWKKNGTRDNITK